MAEHVLRSMQGDFAIAGHSMGGRVALEVFRLAPERIRGIALLDTGTQPLAPGESGEREVTGRQELVGIAQRDGMAAMAARWVLGMVWKPRLNERALIDAVISMFERCSAEIFSAQIRALIARPDAGPLLTRIGARRSCCVAQRTAGLPRCVTAKWRSASRGRRSRSCPNAVTCARSKGPRR